MNQRMSLPEIERVTWIDSTMVAGWIEFSDVADELNLGYVESIGFVVGEDDVCLYLSTSVMGDHESCMSPVSIPLVAIILRAVIEP